MREEPSNPAILNRFLSFSRAISLLVLAGMAAAFVARVEWHGVSGLDLFWQAIVAFLPVILLVAPQFWRRICPFAVLSLSGATRMRAHAGIISRLPRHITVWIKRYGLVVGAAIFWVIAPMRLLLFNQNGHATALLMLALALAALLLGAAGPWKALWCCSLCPIYAVEKFYGAAPFWMISDSRCIPKGLPLNCYRCALHCIDVPQNEGRYWKAMERADSKPAAERMRRFFVGSFPGFVLAYWLLARVKGFPPHRAPYTYAIFLLLMSASYACYCVARRFVATQHVDLAAITLAFNVYYIGASSGLSSTLARLAGFSASFAAEQRFVIIALAFLVSAGWLRHACKVGAGPWTRW